MEKAKLIELIRRQSVQNGIGTFEDNKSISLRQIELACDNMYGDLLFLLLKDSKSIDYFCKSYENVSVEYNRTSNEYYSDLPISVVQLPENKAVHLIRGVGSNRKFYPVTNEDVDLHSDTDIPKYYDRTWFLLDGTSRVKYVNFDYRQSNIRSVQMKLIPSFSTFSWNEDVPIPSGRVTEFVSIVAKTLFQSNKFLDSSADGV